MHSSLACNGSNHIVDTDFVICIDAIFAAHEFAFPPPQFNTRYGGANFTIDDQYSCPGAKNSDQNEDRTAYNHGFCDNDGDVIDDHSNTYDDTAAGVADDDDDDEYNRPDHEVNGYDDVDDIININTKSVYQLALSCLAISCSAIFQLTQGYAESASAWVHNSLRIAAVASFLQILLFCSGLQYASSNAKILCVLPVCVSAFAVILSLFLII